MMVIDWFMFHVELRIMVVGKYVTVFTVDFKDVLVECGEHIFFPYKWKKNIFSTFQIKLILCEECNTDGEFCFV